MEALVYILFYIFLFCIVIYLYRLGALDRDYDFVCSLRAIMQSRVKNGCYDYDNICRKMVALNKTNVFRCNRADEYLNCQEVNEKHLLAPNFRYLKEYKEYVKDISSFNKKYRDAVKKIQEFDMFKKEKGIGRFLNEDDYKRTIEVLRDVDGKKGVGGRSEYVMMLYHVLLNGKRLKGKTSPGSFGVATYYEFLLDVEFPEYPDSYKNSYNYITDESFKNSTEKERIKNSIEEIKGLLHISS